MSIVTLPGWDVVKARPEVCEQITHPLIQVTNDFTPRPYVNLEARTYKWRTARVSVGTKA